MSVETLKESFPEARRASSLIKVRSIWDNYSGVIPDKMTVIARMAEYFPTYKNARAYQPLGSFKAIEGWEEASEEAIYKHWVALLEEPRWSQKLQKEVSMARIIEASLKKSAAYAGISFAPGEASEGLSYLLWTCTDGVLKEIETTKLLQEAFKKYENLTVIAAPEEDEGRDIDAWVCAYGKKIVPISIKNGRALSKQTIITKRSKGKKLPMFYAGLAENDDSKLKIIYAPYEQNGNFEFDHERRKAEVKKIYRQNVR